MESYKLNLAAKTLTITKAFEDAVAKGEGEEYVLYTKFQRDIPGLTIIHKTHKTPTRYITKAGERFSCNQFKNLTYANMERFMSILPNGADYLEVYEKIRCYASKVQTSPYKAVRLWFTAQFPNYRNDPLFYLYNDIPVITNIIPYVEQAEQEAKERAAARAERKAIKEKKAQAENEKAS